MRSIFSLLVSVAQREGLFGCEGLNFSAVVPLPGSSDKIIEGTPARFTCLRRYDCATVPLEQPQDFLAMKEEYQLLGLSNEVVPEFLYTITAVRRSWAEAHKDAIVRYVRALTAAFKFIQD